jgi:hypothetical protein
MEISFSHGKTKLNEEQSAVVLATPYQNQRILASAGSGKTTTITARISWLIEHYDIKPEQILLVTFSRNAAREMIGRIENLCGPVNIWAGTFHALSHQILSKYSPQDSKNMCFIDEYPVRLRQWMLTEKGRLWVGSLRYVIVDEFQDINGMQWKLLETMRHPGVYFSIVGDDAQNIYPWRGSSSKYLLNYHEVVRSVVDYQLRMNYRSTEAIVTVANRVMKKIPTLPWKQTMVSASIPGQKPDVLFFWRLSDECMWVARTINQIRKENPDARIAILSRNNIDLYRIEETLLQECIECRFISHESTHMKESSAVDLTTFHGSKGLEWDYTFCICLSDDRLPGRKRSEDCMSDRRLFYVGITRARKRLFLTYHGNERHLSRFVREIGYKFLQFHGLAKYALSDIELGEQQPSLKSLLDSLDGEDWQRIREKGELPFGDIIPMKEYSFIPFEDTWKPPSWCDTNDFKGFLHLFMKRRIFSHFGLTYQDPFLERIIFRIRIFAEDAKFWELWQDEINEMARFFFADSAKMPAAEYDDVLTWSKKKGVPWEQHECIKATTILAKIRGQLRPLRFEPYSLEEFTICPTRVVCPAEYRSPVLRSWRNFTNTKIPWQDCIIDIWRLSSLHQVAEGRNAALYKIQTISAQIEGIHSYLEKVDNFLQLWLASKQDILLNPECIIDELTPIGCDCIIDSSLIMFTGETRADLAIWTETFLKAFCFLKSGTSVESIQLVNPFRGTVYISTKIPFDKLEVLYNKLLAIWKNKQV